MKLRKSLSLGLCLALSCGNQPNSNPSAPQELEGVYVSFYPLEYFAETIVGETLEVTNYLPAGADPKSWRPNPEQLQELQRFRLLLFHGVGLEAWAQQANLPLSRTHITADRFRKEWIQIGRKTHSHGARGKHSHAEWDSHTWMDPLLALQQAEMVFEILTEAYPEHEDSFRSGFERLQEQLQDLHRQWRELSSAISDVQFYASHPAYNYLSRSYQWKIHNFDWNPQEELTAAAMEPVEGPGILLWESAPLAKNVDWLQEQRQVRSLVFRTAENRTSDERQEGRSYVDIMNANFQRLRDALKP